MAGNASNENTQTGSSRINEWRDRWMREIDSITQQASKEPAGLITEEDLDYQVQEILDAAYHENDSDQNTTHEYDSEDMISPVESLPRFYWNTAGQQSEGSNISANVGQALVIKQSHACSLKCYRDEAGVMAMGKDELAYVDMVFIADNVRMMKMRVAATFGQDTSGYRQIDFPPMNAPARVVDMDYWPTRQRYVLAVVQTGDTYASWHYLFNSSASETEEKFKKWAICEPGDKLSRICCTAQVIYEIVQRFRDSFIVSMDEYGVPGVRKAASDLFSVDSNSYDVNNLRLVDLCCSPPGNKLAVAYNCALHMRRGPVGIKIFDPTRNWLQISHIDLGLTDIQFYMPRITYLYKVDLFVAVHASSGNLLFFNTNGERVGRRPFILYAEEYEDSDPHLKPIKISATQDLVSIRYNRYITIHRILD